MARLVAGDGLGRDRRASAQVLWNIVLGLSCGQQAHPLAADLYRRLSEATADAPGRLQCHNFGPNCCSHHLSDMTVESPAGLTEPQVAELLCKESCNSYGIMAPSGPEVLLLSSRQCLLLRQVCGHVSRLHAFGTWPCLVGCPAVQST